MTRQHLETVLAELGPVAVAVSGGVDSLTLATLAHRLAPGAALMVHAVSPAVPEEATARVRAEGAREGWSLRVIEAGEFADPAYRANPVNRCFFCKTNLYGAIRAETDRQILSGANL
ncbi:MAG: adenine nucleotide alpha hydrolase, partial [Actinomycetospora chiangmaiensis]|nr:adenine nucleotide alpha hydrolase [Actinomycetospora chiangmaiensis]